MPERLPTFLEIKAKLDSGSNAGKSSALYDLLKLVKRDVSAHAKALPIFLGIADNSANIFQLNPAIRGIGVISGYPEERRRWLALLDHPDEWMVRIALGGLEESKDPTVLEAIAHILQHPILALRRNAVTALGRLGAPQAFPILQKALEHPELRGYAVEALGELGDPRAIPLLHALLDDKTDAWPIDNHGPIMSVGEVAQETLARMQKRVG